MREEFVCAKCGQKLDEKEGAFVLQDNFLIARYFDDYKSNRFCSPLCAAEALFGEYVPFNELPLDDDEKETKTEEEEED